MSSIIKTEYFPETVSPPGESLKENLDYLKFTQKELAARTESSEKHISLIIKGKEPISPSFSIKLERVLGIPASFWNEREIKYREYLARIKELDDMENDLDWLSNFPIRELKKRHWIENTKDKKSQLRDVLGILSIASARAFNKTWENQTELAYRKASKSDPFPLSIWLSYGKRKAEELHLPPFNNKLFKSNLAKIRTLTVQKGVGFVDKIVELCNEAGVGFLLVKELPKARVSGATYRLGENPIIQMSLRFKTNDHFWFTFFHEAAHVLLHGKKLIIEENGIDNKQEREANEWASNYLIPEVQMKKFINNGRFSKQAIMRLAMEIGIAPGIIVGQLQHRNLLPYAHCNDLKIKYDWAEE